MSAKANDKHVETVEDKIMNEFWKLIGTGEFTYDTYVKSGGIIDRIAKTLGMSRTDVKQITDKNIFKTTILNNYYIKRPYAFQRHNIPHYQGPYTKKMY